MAERDDLDLWEGYGIEIEWMIVDAHSLDVRPVADHLLAGVAGHGATEFEDGAVTWTNELARHLIEAKSTGPMPTLAGADAVFASAARTINARLAPEGLCLLPGPMHPWMQPEREFQQFPHGQDAIYRLFDQVFNCRGHGWSNLQSQQINLPFHGDASFGRLMAAVRVLMPLLPSLTAASPFVEGAVAGTPNHRLTVYAGNCARVPSITAQVIPEPVFTIDAYHELVLAPILRDMAAYDPEGLLDAEWTNARGAIVRFSRNCIEIRVMDTQECPAADLALAELVVAVARGLVEEHWSSHAAQARMAQDRLVHWYQQAVHHAEGLRVEDRAYLALFDYRSDAASGWQLWERLIEQAAAAGSLSATAGRHCEHWLRHGSLARRLVQAVGPSVSRSALRPVYRRMADCLQQNSAFV